MNVNGMEGVSSMEPNIRRLTKSVYGWKLLLEIDDWFHRDFFLICEIRRIEVRNIGNRCELHLNRFESKI